ncbi:gliding motility-associated C-terminal domain-containing protein [Mucilaginibacter sp. KACC 22063]
MLWDGRYKGQDLPAGVYYYIINPKSGRKTMSGSITIIR